MRTDFSAVLTPRPLHPAEGTLTVGPWQVDLDAAPASVIHDAGLTAVVKGQFYDLDGPGLLRLYRQHGPDCFRHLDGAFSALLLDKEAGTALAVTDRAGTHKLYAAHDQGGMALSTLPDHPDFARRPYTLGGVASVMISGSPMNGLTLYQGVSSLEAASLHHLRPGGTVRQAYWTPEPPDWPDTRPEAELREEFAALLVRAVRRRAGGLDGPAHLSLSGGHDSRGLLSLLTGAGVDLRTFSYAQGPQAAGSDIRVADALAGQYGTPHQEVQAYQGDLLATIRRNAGWGRGVANFCDEADAWAALSQQPITDFFAGEQIHDAHARPLHDVSEQLTKRHLRPFDTLGQLTARLDPQVLRGMQAAWNAEIAEIRGGLARITDPSRQEFLLLARQVMPYRLLPWREQYAGRFAAVHLPYLDAAVMDFVARLPPAALAGKRLFKETLRALDPDIYRVPLARSQGYETDWHAELIRHREAIREELLSGRSRLDAVIDPLAIRAVLDQLAAPAAGRPKLKGQLRQALGAFRHSDLGQQVFGQARLRAAPVRPATWLLRVLTLRALDAGKSGG
ncbi:asparagine synthase-related protein [Deinococcus frigens]|uniref:asparagine synthase-related protein n=1 Tax=Deinococcus frigens TaxID=249403 RepID=UPI0004976EE7|nr:asparagine synthase-related protein [Deinococcus frigens]